MALLVDIQHMETDIKHYQLMFVECDTLRFNQCSISDLTNSMDSFDRESHCQRHKELSSGTTEERQERPTDINDEHKRINKID